MKAIFYKSLFSVIEVLTGGMLASIEDDNVSEEMIKNDVNVFTQKVLRLTRVAWHYYKKVLSTIMHS